MIYGETEGTFDPVTGNYQFSSIDKQNFPEGLYELEITGTIGSLSDSFTLEIELVDPCPTASLTMKDSPILDLEYVIGEPMQ